MSSRTFMATATHACAARRLRLTVECRIGPGDKAPDQSLSRPSAGLTAHQVQIALDYATAYPKAGRPYPARSLKRIVGALAEAGAFDAELTGR